MLKVVKEAPAFPKAKVKAFKAKKAVLKGVHSHKKRRCGHHPPFHSRRHFSSKECPQERQLDHYVIKFPLTVESAMKKTEVINTLVFIMDVKANKAPEQQSLAKINTLIRYDGEKKAYIGLAPNYDALDVANKIGII
ncbi:large ribosomal subunit protein uL23-like [Glossophaga mutica]